MRLTLRTLLAYLDDILPPTETKEIGEKIAASPVAQQLVDRIRDVPRRRRLTAPEPSGAKGGIDANLMSEYLDNCLPANLVADVERICLESDVNLAEVAACHQILALALGEPVTVPNRLRDRMYALGPQGESLDVAGDAPPPSQKVRETNAREQLSAIQGAEQTTRAVAPARSLESRLPDYLKRPPLWRRLLPWGLALLVIGAWLGWLYHDPSLFGIRPVAQEDEGGKQDVAQADVADDRQKERVAAVDRPPQRQQPAVAPEPVEHVEDPPIDPPPPGDMPIMTDGDAQSTDAGSTDKGAVEDGATDEASGEGVPDGSGEPMDEGQGDENAADTQVADANPAVPVEGDADAAEADPAGETILPITIADRRGVILYERSENSAWYPIPGGKNPPEAGEIAVPSPEPFFVSFSVEKSPWQIDALRDSRFAPFRTTDAPMGLEVTQGRFRFSPRADAAADAADLSIALRLGVGHWRIQPVDQSARFAIEAQPLQPDHVGHDVSKQSPQGIVYVMEGEVRLTSSGGGEETISKGERAILTPSRSTGALPEGEPVAAVAQAEGGDDADAPAEESTDEVAGDEGSDDGVVVEELIDDMEKDGDGEQTSGEEAVDGITPVQAAQSDPELPLNIPANFPAWVVPHTPNAFQLRSAESFAKEFLPEAPVSESLLPAIHNRLFFVSEPAARGLALIGDVDGMLKTLRDAELTETRLAAVGGLRNWLGRSPENGETLKEKLLVIFGRQDLVDIYSRLLWGYNSEAGRNLDESRQLVGWLDHPDIAVRELAFYYANGLSDKEFDYKAIHNESRRSGSIKRWSDYVERNGGLSP